jgi:hypothetical protein
MTGCMANRPRSNVGDGEDALGCLFGTLRQFTSSVV